MTTSDETMNLGVECGICGGSVYMETCPVADHDWAIASECQRCGVRYVFETGCDDCRAVEEARP